MPVYALVDCNNFYASCERVFQPHLKDKPVVVLSNNDGCAIARSQEAKDMGIAMGVPFFKIRHLMREGLQVFSSNYALYGDMSHRVMSCLADFTPVQEVYSIDECFLGLEVDAEPQALVHYARTIRQTVHQWTGIPVSIGIGPTKTLAKLANRLAKKDPTRGGVDSVMDRAGRHYGLATTPIGDVWGIGRRFAKTLQGEGIHTALDLVKAPPAWVRRKMGVVGLRTAEELRGHACLALEDHVPDKQNLCVTRSFGQVISARTALEEALKTFASRAAEKARQGGLVAHHVMVILRTNPFQSDHPQYRASQVRALPYASNDTRVIIRTVGEALDQIYREGYAYKKAGVYLLDLCRPNAATGSFWGQPDPAGAALMQAVDRLNGKYGSHTLTFGHTQKSRAWYATRNLTTPCYTTSWQGLKVVG